MQIIKFKENTLEVSTPLYWDTCFTPKIEHTTMYIFLRKLKYIITVIKSHHTIIFNFSEFKKKVNKFEFKKKKGEDMNFSIFLIMTHICTHIFLLKLEIIHAYILNFNIRKFDIQLFGLRS